MNTPTVSIIIPAHGHAGMTEHCVRAALSSTDGNSQVEVVVVDDATQPPLALTPSSRLRVIRADANLGFSRACNLGAREASNDVLVFLNNDTEVQAEWLQRMLDCLVPDVAIVGARLLYRDGTAQHAGIIFSQQDGAPRHVYRGFPGEHPAVTRTRDMQAVTGACLMIRKADFLPSEFDEAFVNGFEDIDLCLRMRTRGRRVVYCGSATVTHLESVSLRRDAAADAERHDSNLARFSDRWGAHVVRDELATYADDALLRITSGDVYPLSAWIAPELATVTSDEIGGLLNIRSRQVFDLEKEVGALSARLLDLGETV